MAIDRADFAEECIREGLNCGANPHYIMTVAQLRSQIAEGTVGNEIGPFRLTQADWDAHRKDPQFEISFESDDINDSDMQIPVFAAMVRRAFDSFVAAQNHNPTAQELYVAQFPTAPTANLTADLQAALDATAGLIATTTTRLLGPAQTPPPTIPGPDQSILAGDGKPLPFDIPGLSQSLADEETAFFRDSGATVTATQTAAGIFTLKVTPAQGPLVVQPPPPVATSAPAMDGYVLCLDRIRTERRSDKAFDRTVSRYQAFFNRQPIPEISGMAVERQGPGDNSPTGVSQHRRIAAGVYPLFTHASGATNKYRTIGFSTPANIQMHPWPCVGVENTGNRSGILIHCASGYLMSIGCINLTSNVANAQTNVLFSDSWSRVKALIDSIRSHLGGSFPGSNNVRLPTTSLLIRE